MKPIELITKRVKLRRARESDAEHLFLYTKDPDCSRFLTREPHAYIDQTRNFLSKWGNLAWEQESNKCLWVVSLSSNDEVIGIFIAIVEGHKTQIHFGLRREFWRQGYTTEIIQCTSDWLMSDNTLQRIYAVCDLENLGSMKALEKSGFKREGIFRKWLILPAFNNTARDCYIYSRIKDETPSATLA